MIVDDLVLRIPCENGIGDTLKQMGNDDRQASTPRSSSYNEKFGHFDII